MDFITAGDYKNYLARMFQFDWTKVCLIMIASAIFFLLIYTITQWKHLNFWGICVCMLLGVYMGCVAGVTLYNRTPTGVHRANLDLFWSYRAYFETGSRIRIVEGVCNIVMLVPFGILVPILLRWTRNFAVFFLCDLAFTVFIEGMQYYTTRGLFELDDIFNNALGGVAGFLIFSIIYTIIRDCRRLFCRRHMCREY